MTQEKSSTSSGNYKVIGAGKVLAYLRGDLQQAKKSILVIGPWLDGFFIRELISYLRKSINVRCLVRVGEREELVGDMTYQALQELSLSFPDIEARSLASLHAKVIIIDDCIVYLGSTNWYKYSLEQAKEVTIRTRILELKDLQRIIDGYWESAEAIDINNEEDNVWEEVGRKSQQKNEKMSKIDSTSKQKRTPEINHEVLDPIVLKALQKNPKAFIKRRKN